MGFTDAQKKAIKTHDCNVLVSAAAGSGKTTVLVERIINRLLDENDPIDVDRMLVLTFTNAAASQMRDKIAGELEKRAKECPDNAHLARQTLLVHNAQISTFHTFCQEIIRNHFYEIGVEPGLRVVDEGEGKLMRADALINVLERSYESEDDDFYNLVESFATGKNDKILERVIENIYKYSQAQPRPEEWLSKCEDFYDIKNADDLKGKSWFLEYIESIKSSAADRRDACIRLLELCDIEGGPAKYRPTLEYDYDILSSIASAGNYEQLFTAACAYEKKNLDRITAKDGVDAYIKEYVKNERGSLAKYIEGLSKELSIPLEEKVADIRSSLPLVKEFIRLTGEFSAEYAKAKEEASVIDFNDMEHMAIRILENPDGVTAGEYRDRFVEIYVDEYQDSNLTQEEIVNAISRPEGESGGNVFMVGDVKQSIYRFRMARPDLFLSKYNSYLHSPGKNENMRIDFSHNFRSRPEVLNSANEIFEKIMVKEIGGIEYDDAASLHYGGVYEDYPGEGYRSELILGVREEGVSEAETEARLIGDRIKEIVGKLDIRDSITGGFKKADYSDIVILLRGMKGRDTVYKEVLESMGIPSYVTCSGGYFSAGEVETLLSFLQVIDNPLNDIPLATTLRSFFGGFNDEELGIVRAGSKNEYLYHSLKDYAAGYEKGEMPEKYNNRELYNKCYKILQTIAYYRDETKRKSVYEIVNEIISGEYGDYVRLGANGVKAEANLNMLLTKAEDFGKISYKGLFHFLRYIDSIRKYEVDYSEAGVSDETDNVVRIMTIHKSKGLEFPVVFLSAMTKNRNTKDETADVLIEADCGLGIEVTDPVKRTKKPTLIKTYIKRKLKKENLAEEIRIMYVALTRAQEKLIMVGAVKDPAKEYYENTTTLDACNSYLDLMVYTKNKTGRLKETDVIEKNFSDIIMSAVAGTLDDADRLGALAKIAQKCINTPNMAELHLSDELSSLYFRYPYEGQGPTHFKLSVSDLKKQSYEDAIEKESEDDFADKALTAELYTKKDGDNAGAFYGTAFHRMLELWDYSVSFEREDSLTDAEASEFYDSMLQKGRIDKMQLEAVKIEEITSFIKSDLGRRMAKSNAKGRLFREQPFVLGIDAKDVERMQSGADGSVLLQIPEDENMMLVQGIIDAYWVEDDGIVILDYKTDRVKSKEELIKRYHVQLDYYEKALFRLTDLPVKEKIIYSARLHEEISV